ncbi:MAG TPA: exodeoxyribonuclease I [Candidatus Saccharimonadales bacterium]|nr:exodeoxyribonuclease I [Candidatus Saccharimonadales bacterium]
MAATFFFYDLETSGISPREARIMQFAGQRTDMDLKPVGEPVNIHIKLTPDVVPEPDAILLTGITPQQTIADGITEAEFLKFFYEEVVKSGTIFLGYNTIRFDDEFMRFLHYRNFYDPYEWHWSNDCSRWDLLDVVRMTRALRPEGIEWPFASDGKPTNRLEYLTKVNKLDHKNAHDALADVNATIAVAKLIKAKQPRLFEHLLEMRDKRKVEHIVKAAEPFTYASGRYPSDVLHTTAAVFLADSEGGALVYDLRHDPKPFLQMNVDELAEAMRWSKDPEKLRLPVKALKYNHCPAIAPGVVKDQATLERLRLNLDDIITNLRLLRANESFARKVAEADARLKEERRTQTGLVDDELTVDTRLYDGFFDNKDKAAMREVRAAAPEELGELAGHFTDQRLKSLLPLYKARNFPAALTSEERAGWDSFCQRRLMEGAQSGRLGQYFKRLQELAASPRLSEKQRYLLEELQLYGESIVPAEL